MLVLGVRGMISSNLGFLQKRDGAVGMTSQDAFASYYEELDMASAAASNDDPLPAEEPMAPPLAPRSSFAVGGMLALSALTLPGLIMLTLLGKCCRDSISVEAAEPTLRHLGEPLAAGQPTQQPHATTGAITAACNNTSGGCNLVPAYLAAVYARALQ
mmetsp:Transcript_133427/g.259796  ORF Transcript_133427/g.259796 Transcript_133427/m.259796 type:complete len:158 (-) Transcript_133427:3-476(-)